MNIETNSSSSSSVSGSGSDNHYVRNSSKLVAMLVLIIADLIFNCTLDYDLYNNDRSFIEGNQNLDWDGGVLSALLILQVIVQISIFLALFLAMADTFLFRVGLLGVLMQKFRSVLILHPIYFTITIIAGTYRLTKINNHSFLYLWKDDDNFLILSVLQKILSVPYYLFNIRGAVKLGSRIYFDKDMYVALLKENKSLNEFE